jgi:hypothetical protein
MMEQAPGHIATFYSYKGGTGRSMALANFAWIMAASGKRVLAIDWDLEAPGLHRYFRPFLVDPDLFETDGLIDAFWSIAASTVARAPSGEKLLDPGDSAETAAEALEDATRRLDWKFPTGGYIDFIGAGRQGETYSGRVNSFDWKRFYELGGSRILTMVKTHLRTRYEWVLIDSRTGISDTSGICTIQMPDVVVAYFTLNRQSIDGVSAILRSIRAFRSASIDGSSIDFFPIATRIENAEQGRLEVARGYARTALADFLPKAMQSSPREYWDKMEISYRPAYAFEEILAAFGDATGAWGAADTMLSQVETTAQRITGDETLRMPEILEADRARVLAKYVFGAVPPSAAKKAHTVDEAEDSDFLRGVLAKEQLWRTSEFKWRLLLSSRELDLLTEEDRKKFGRNMAFYLLQSERMRRFLRTTTIGSFVTFALSAAAAALMLPAFSFVRVESTFSSAVYLTYGFLFCWMLFSLVWSAMAPGRPHGVTLFQVFTFTLLGPFRPHIRDYESLAVHGQRA